MAVPDFQSLMLPFLKVLSDGQLRAMRDVTAILSDEFKLTETERNELLPSGEARLIVNRVAWAKTHLKSAGLIENPTRGQVCISMEGKKALASKPDYINCKYLKQYPSYLKFIGQSPDDSATSSGAKEVAIVESIKTPQELIETSFQTLRKATSDELLERLKKSSPAFFEIVVVKLLQALGYGATGDALVTGKSGDGGIDGIIKEDKLGLDIVCVQAKRWEGTVGRPTIQAFVGSMDFVRARKGVVITTSGFSKEAMEYVDRIEGKKVVLLDGLTLAGLMIDYDVGVNVTKRYELKEVSNDFFEDDEG